MRRRPFMPFSIAFALLACTAEAPPEPPPAPSESPERRFNLILVSIDTLRADHIGAYGYPLPTTPHIDELAADSLRFESCVAHAPITLSSHASLLTSLLPRHHGASVYRESRLAEGVTTLAEVLRSHGYATASFNGGIQLDAAYGLDRGFDVYVSAKPPGAAAKTLAGEEDRLGHAVDQALAWLDGASAPFFVFLHSYEIHHPYTPAPEYLAHFETDYTGALPEQIPVELLEDINEGRRPVDAADVAHVVRSYDAELRSADDAFGRLVAQLRERGLYDDTLIVLTSDHGEEFAEHGRLGWHAHTLYDELLLVPLILKFPRSRFAGVVEAAQARGIDVAPTALAALGLDAPASFAGRDLAPDGAVSAPRAAVSMHDVPGDAPLWSLRVRGWKLKQVGRESLFDLADDPLETKNVVGRNPARAAGMRRTGLALLDERERPRDVPAALDPEIGKQLRELGYVE